MWLDLNLPIFPLYGNDKGPCASFSLMWLKSLVECKMVTVLEIEGLAFILVIHCIHLEYWTEVAQRNWCKCNNPTVHVHFKIFMGKSVTLAKGQHFPKCFSPNACHADALSQAWNLVGNMVVSRNILTRWCKEGVSVHKNKYTQEETWDNHYCTVCLQPVCLMEIYDSRHLDINELKTQL